MYRGFVLAAAAPGFKSRPGGPLLRVTPPLSLSTWFLSYLHLFCQKGPNSILIKKESSCFLVTSDLTCQRPTHLSVVEDTTPHFSSPPLHPQQDDLKKKKVKSFFHKEPWRNLVRGQVLWWKNSNNGSYSVSNWTAEAEACISVQSKGLFNSIVILNWSETCWMKASHGSRKEVYLFCNECDRYSSRDEFWGKLIVLRYAVSCRGAAVTQVHLF